MFTLLHFFVSLAIAVNGCASVSAQSRDAALLETGGASTGRPAPVPPDIKIVSYNIRYADEKEITQLAQLLRDDPDIGGAPIVGLQEVDRRKHRTANVNTVRLLAGKLGFYYAWAGQPWRDEKQTEEDTGIALLSAWPIRDVERIVLPYVGPNGRRRVALGATIQIGDVPIRVYVVHSERRIGTTEHLAQFEAVLSAASSRNDASPVVILGDLNTHRFVSETTEIFSRAGFTSHVPSSEPTFHVGLLTYRLDWIWLKGLRPSGGGVARHVKLSDHWPIWTTIALR